jgi:hypothetical protein
MRSKYIIVFAIVSIFVFTTTSTAAAVDRPLVEVTEFTTENEVMANCGAFLIIANGAGSIRLTTYFNREGDPVRSTFQGRYKGTMTNSVTGYSIADDPSVANIFFDLVQGTQTNIGAFFTVTVPGTGAVLIEAGRLVFDGGGPPVFIAGPHRPPNETIRVLCHALDQ